MAKKPKKQPGERPHVPEETDVPGYSKERAKLINNPDLNQAGNERGSADQTEGAQTGKEVDLEEEDV
jgi:hypothetical protein